MCAVITMRPPKAAHCQQDSRLYPARILVSNKHMTDMTCSANSTAKNTAPLSLPKLCFP